MLSEGQAEADRPHGHAGHPQPYLQHREHQEAPNNLAAGAHPSSVIIPSRSERETNHPPSSFHYPPYPFRPLPDPKTFLSSPAKHYPQGLDFQNRRPSSRIGPEAKESLHPLTRSDRNRRIFPGFGGRSPGEESARVEGLSRRSQKPGGARSKEPRSRGAVQSSAASQVSAGNQLPSNLPDSSGSPSFLAEEMNLASRRSKAELLRASLPPLLRLLSFVFVVTQSASASPSVPRLSGRIYSVPRSSQLLCRQKKRPCLTAFFRLGFFSLVVVLFPPLSLGLILLHFSDLIGI